MADTTTPYRTIPEVLSDAAARHPDRTWLRTDEGCLTFAQAAAQVAVTARALHDAGVRHGDLVLVTARTTPPYLLCWLAPASIGAVTVSANPRSAAPELAGLAHQTQPAVVITDTTLGSLVTEAEITGLRSPGVLDADELTAGWATASTSPGCPRRESARMIWPCSSPPQARPAGPSWSCRPTARTRWQARVSRTGWA